MSTTIKSTRLISFCPFCGGTLHPYGVLFKCKNCGEVIAHHKPRGRAYSGASSGVHSAATIESLPPNQPPIDAAKQRELDDLVSKLCALLGRSRADEWFTTPHELLDGREPIRVVYDEKYGIDKVRNAIFVEFNLR